MRLSDIHVCHVTTAHFVNDVRVYRRECVQIRSHMAGVTLIAPSEGRLDTNDDIHIVPFQSKRPTSWGERFLAAVRAASIAKRQNADLYHFHDPELLLPMANLGRITGKPIVFDSHEYYPATIAQDRGVKGHFLAFMYRILERLALKYIDGVVSVTPQIIGLYTGCVPHVALVRNYPDIDEILKIIPSFRSPISGRLFFSGSLQQKSLFPLADAVAELIVEFPDLHLQLAGHFDSQEFQSQLISYWRECGVGDSLQYLGRISHSDLLIHASQSTIGLVLFWPFENVLAGLPNKLFEYMAVGLPVLVADAPYQREVVEKAQCGLWCDTTSKSSIAGALRTLLNNPATLEEMRCNGRQACIKNYQMKNETRTLLSFYETILNPELP